jgi:membrane-bound lytic murein transglycosylase B
MTRADHPAVRPEGRHRLPVHAASTPRHAKPVHSAPVHSAPVHSAPVHSAPVAIKPGRPKTVHPVHAPTKTSTRRLVVVGALATGLIGAAALSATVFHAQSGFTPRAAAERAPATGSGQLDGSAEAGQVGPLLSAADLAALRTAGASAVLDNVTLVSRSDGSPASSLAADGIPATALLAYQQAAEREGQRKPACGITWPLLAGIGRVESNHGRFAGATLHSDGLSSPPVVGIPLDGHGTALIVDTDAGRMDGDMVYDRAVGPMQFIPSTWAGWGVDLNNDGAKDPFNIFDAAAAAADYLCAAGRDLTTAHGQVQAILSYNYSYDYVDMVMDLEHVYASGVGIIAPVRATGTEPRRGPPEHKPTLPPVDPGTPRGAPTPTPSPSPTTSIAASPSVPNSSPSDPVLNSSNPATDVPPPESSNEDPSPSDTPVDPTTSAQDSPVPDESTTAADVPPTSDVPSGP